MTGKHPAVVGSVSWAVLLAMLPSLTNARVASFVAGSSAAVLLLVASLIVSRRVRRWRLRVKRGVVEIASDRSRTEQFSLPWDRAKQHVLCWGVGMSNVVGDKSLIEHTVRRGCSITFEMIDPVWLRQRPQVCEEVDVTYGRKNFVDRIEESYKQLVAIRDEMNHKYGADRVQVTAVQKFQSDSATVADPGTSDAWGFVEFHTPGFPHGQTRMRLVTYDSSGPLDPPLLDHLVNARRSLPRRSIPVTALGNQQLTTPPVSGVEPTPGSV